MPKTPQIGFAGLGTDLERFCRLASGGNWLRAQPPQKYPKAIRVRELALSVSYESHAKGKYIMPLLRLRLLLPGE